MNITQTKMEKVPENDGFVEDEENDIDDELEEEIEEEFDEDNDSF